MLMVDEPVVEVSESPTDEPLLDIEFNDTSEISVPPRIIDQVIGQDSAVEIVKKAALQKRHIMLIGEP
ncbi:MAG: hypothetical protein ACTSQE_15985, partial [Candidatus Heimdallarchaeaceae archaeon]